ncbi:MAG: DCC1-like thiol-disulfide oxidoreductase family protein [Hyphomonadaceae bacterium]
MRWAPVAAPELEDLILFDGDCVLCSRAAHFVHKRDRAQCFKFVAIQSAFGRALAVRFGIDADAPETNAAVVSGIAHFKADAALAVLAALPGWRWTRIAKLAPRALRNWLYDRIARNRYRIFGRRERCWIGDPALAARIVERAP